jgi:hypothetical protein
MAMRLRTTKRARARVGAARVMMMVMRVAGNKEGNGNFGKRDGYGDKGGGQATETATIWVIVTATRVAGWW